MHRDAVYLDPCATRSPLRHANPSDYHKCTWVLDTDSADLGYIRWCVEPILINLQSEVTYHCEQSFAEVADWNVASKDVLKFRPICDDIDEPTCPVDWPVCAGEFGQVVYRGLDGKDDRKSDVGEGNMQWRVP